MLDLQTRIGLNEKELAFVLLGSPVHQEFECAQAAVVRRAGHPQRCGGDPAAQVAPQPGARSDLNQLLMSALYAAISLAQLADGATVADDLDLDVASPFNELLDIDIGLPKCCPSFRLTAGIRLLQPLRIFNHAHAPATATRDRLDHQPGLRTQARHELAGLRERRGPRGAPQDGHVKLSRQFARFGLIAKQREQLGRGTNEYETGLAAATGKLSVFAQEAVARVYRFATTFERRHHHSLNVQIGRRPRAGKGDGAYRSKPMQRRLVIG